MSVVYSILFIFLLINNAIGTHNRAGEIRYRHVNGYTYEITLITYTYTLSPADRPELEIHWGDGTSSIIPRVSKVELPDYYFKNTYIGLHTYPGPGVYRIYMEDQNRNYGVQNIPNSVEVPFAVQTILNINPLIMSNNTPILTYPPIDKAKLNATFIHNPGAYDPDGDSLAYRLTVCLGEDAQPIEGYTFPYASDSLVVNPITGDLIWERPQQTGYFNVAMVIEEWRYFPSTKSYIKIGEIERDIQIEVYEANNDPPYIYPIQNFCVWAGDTLSFIVKASDPQNDKMVLSAYGGPFECHPPIAVFDSAIGYSPLTQTFKWSTSCVHVKKFPYLVVFKAKDFNSELNLVFQRKCYIQVVCPPIDSLYLFPTSSTIEIKWPKTKCTNALYYEVYRKIDPSGWNPDSCETGIPGFTGFQKIYQTANIYDTVYLDNNNGNGLLQGYTYCYRIVVVFSDGAKSIASPESCTELVKGIPVITHVSVIKTKQDSGVIYIEWSRPIEFDTINAPGPYQYLIYHSNDFWGANLVLLDSLNDINDTIYIDSLLNTLNYPFSYKIEFYNNQQGNRFLIGFPSIASSIFLKSFPDDKKIKLKWQKNVPWKDTLYVVYRFNEILNTWDSIGYSYIEEYEDVGLINLKTYCYKVKGIGIYTSGKYNMPFINYSQELCDYPRDTIPPCAPNIKIKSNCEFYENVIKWNKNELPCADDIIGYKLYYSPTLDGQLQLLKEFSNPDDSIYIHKPDYSIAGCYVLTAIDSFYNESPKIYKSCIDECVYYTLPNIFTPNEDSQNDYYQPGPYKYVEKVDMQIFNRWGKLVFKTNNPDIMWDGRDMDTKKRVSDGVYYYICDVYERRLTGIEVRNITGFIYVMSPKSKKEP
ncbi:MAG: gliding motility-associated C-terminal domain-containing protein [Bacteroidales bacterium]|nr:gliding motility-associated C-terminal domain-containing protein [Bacteroidales bacterium]